MLDGVGGPRRSSSTRALGSLVVLALLGLALAPPAAAAGPPHVELRVIADAEQGPVNLLSAVVRTAPRARCELSVTVGHTRKTFHSHRLGSVVWNWTEPADAPKGVWTFLATCHETGYWAARRFRGELGFPTLGGALMAPTSGSGAAGRSGALSCDTQGVCFAEDPFAVGQCGWYAEGRRPDLLGIVGIVHDDAGAWLEEAAGKVPEGKVPVVGALAIWTPDKPPYSGALGHVAYVAAVAGSRIFVDDSNWRVTPWSPELEVHEHWLPASSVSGYIYGGPAGNGP